MAKIGVEHGVDIAFDDAVIAQHPGDGAIAVARGALGGVDFIVERELAAGEIRERLLDRLESAIALLFDDEARAGDRASIDHRVEGLVLAVQADRVESFAARLDADALLDQRMAETVQRQGEDKGL